MKENDTFWDSRDPVMLSMLTRALVSNGYFSYVEVNQLRLDRRNDDPVDVLWDVWCDIVDVPSPETTTESPTDAFPDHP